MREGSYVIRYIGEVLNEVFHYKETGFVFKTINETEIVLTSLLLPKLSASEDDKWQVFRLLEDKCKSLFSNLQLLHKIPFTPILYKKINLLASQIWKEIILKFDSEYIGSILTIYMKKLFRQFYILQSK